MDVGMVLTVALVAVGILLLLLVLVQRGRSTGLFLGAGDQSLLGAKTTESITWATAATFGLFLILAALLNRVLV